MITIRQAPLGTLKRFSCLLVLMSASAAVSAAPTAINTPLSRAPLDDTSHFGFGATTSITERPFVGVDSQDEGLPYFSIRYKRFSVEGLDAGLDLFKNDNSVFGLLLTPRFYEVKSSFADDGELNGIDTTHRTVFAGVSYQYQHALFQVAANALKDVGGESDGTEANLTVSRGFNWRDFTIAPSLGLVWQDGRLVEHFYGVADDETAPGRPAYGEHSSLNYQAALTGIWTPGKHWHLLAVVKEDYLGEGITDSPIIDERSLTSVAVGAVFYFW